MGTKQLYNDCQLSKKQIFLSRFAFSVALLLLGAFLLLCALNIIDLPILKVIIPAVLFTFSVICILLGFIQSNTLLIWLFSIFALSGVVSALAAFTNFTYSTLYPLYIFAPCLASITTCLFSKQWQHHLKTIVFFGGSFLIFCLHGFFNLKLILAISIFVMFLAVGIFLYSVVHKEK